MWKFNGFTLPLITLLLLTSVFTQNSLVFGSPVIQNKEFNRPDPLRHFKPYNGGYDIHSRHYWASAAFTGVHGYAIAMVWILFGLGFGSYLILKNFNAGLHPNVDHPTSYYIILFLVIALFTLLAIIFSSLIMVANQSSFHESKNLMHTVFGAASDIQQTMRKVINGLLKIQMLLEPYDSQTSQLLNKTVDYMRKETVSIQNFVKEGKHTSDHAIVTMYTANLVFVTVNLLVLVAGCVLLFLHWHPGFIIIIFFCWILTTVSWILTGFDFFFHTFAGDTCSAFEDFEENPQNSSIMSMLSSCANSSSSDNFLMQIGYMVHTFITESDSKITSMAHQMFQPDEQSEDSFIVDQICDPFSGAPNYSYTPGNCPENSIQISDLPNVLTSLTCKEQTLTESCKAEGRFLPQQSSEQAMAYIQSIQELTAMYSDLQSLAECTPVINAISDVALHQCKPFRASIMMLWSCILCLSVVTVILTLLWITKAYQEKGRHFPICSILPIPADSG